MNVADEARGINLISPLIKIIQDREEMYLQALGFAMRNIESSSNDLDQIYIFSKFLKETTVSENCLAERER